MQYEFGSGETAFQWKFSKTQISKVFLKQSKFFKYFLKTTFVHVSCYPDQFEPRILFRFSKSGPFDIRFWTRGFLLVMRSRKAGFPLHLGSASLEAEALPSEVRIEDDSDRKLSKSKFKIFFPGIHFSPVFIIHYESKIFFRENFFWK